MNFIDKLESRNNKEDVFSMISEKLSSLGISSSKIDTTRPWGGFFVIHPNSLNNFMTTFFPDELVEINQKDLPLSPKILVVAPKQKLSWQYHNRRSELWRWVQGDSLIARSLDDTEGISTPIDEYELVRLAKGERHRLIGGENWSIVAEIWVHSDPASPSDEDDIIRLSDVYSRK